MMDDEVSSEEREKAAIVVVVCVLAFVLFIFMSSANALGQVRSTSRGNVELNARKQVAVPV